MGQMYISFRESVSDDHFTNVDDILYLAVTFDLEDLVLGEWRQCCHKIQLKQSKQWIKKNTRLLFHQKKKPYTNPKL